MTLLSDDDDDDDVFQNGLFNLLVVWRFMHVCVFYL